LRVMSLIDHLPKIFGFDTLWAFPLRYSLLPSRLAS